MEKYMKRPINIGLTEETHKMVSEKLIILLSNEYLLYVKTLNFHWNITGKSFIALHQLMEAHYEWLKVTVDNVAERIRALGFITPVHYKKYHPNALMDEGNEEQSAEQMLVDLVTSHEKVIQLIRNTIKEIENHQDYASEDLLIKILGKHEKNLWMLRSHLQTNP